MQTGLAHRNTAKLFFYFILLCFITMPIAKACTLTYGRYLSDPIAAEKKWPNSPLHKALEEGSQCTVIFKAFASEHDLLTAAMKHEVDLAYLKDFSFYLLQKKDPQVKPLVVTLSYRYPDKKLSPFYSSYILTLTTHSKIKSLSDLAGKNIGFLSPTSTSGFIIPAHLFAQQNINLKTYFHSITFYHDDDDALYQALLTGKVDAIATWDDVILRNKIGPIKILAAFPAIPNPAIVVVNSLSKEKFIALQQTLIHLPYANNVRFPIQGYARPPQDLYATLFKLFDTTR